MDQGKKFDFPVCSCVNVNDLRVLLLLQANDKGEIEITGNPNKSWGWIHVWDLANLYTLVAGANKALVAGEIFNALDGVFAASVPTLCF